MESKNPVHFLVDACFAHRALKRVQNRHKSYEAAVEAVREKISELTVSLASEKSALQSCTESQNIAEAQLSQFEQQLNQLTSAINTGRVGNYDQAVEQQNTLKESISNLEDRILELLEEAEVLPERIDQIDERIAQLNNRLDEKISEHEDIMPDLQAEADVAKEDLRLHLSKIPEREQRRFMAVRAKHSVLVVPLVANGCGGCHLSLPLDTVSLIMRGNNIYRCSNCGVFIVDPSFLLERE